ncbi:DUF47 family protein [Eggerthellaceae bacterium zg-1084]|uniref:DUF47 family protein n=1 Tax=Berryella wangjianweii TaxID=2734634 RepID=A0A6M8JB92_9ACTN|nr:DUF47 family protein [Berryella wangjianweii]NPD32100.1 DUF47 family protein [Eggerthellaceae bacterium zg-997]QKF08012.1 DUF47 family protein [Berryella wangjianweii]
MARKKKFDYFDAFVSQAKVACREAELLVEVAENFTTASELEPVLKRAHDIENEGDEINHQIMGNIANDFMTPIDREDLIGLAQCMDNVTDSIEEIIQRFYMYDVHYMDPDAVEMAHLIHKSALALCSAMEDFRNFKKSKKLHSLIMDVNDYEEQADLLYLQSIRRLYTMENDNAVRVEVWSRILDRMERCCDQLEHAGDIMSTIMVKYT